MKPIDQFYFIRNNLVDEAPKSLLLCYQPIVGLSGVALYQLLLALFDQGQAPHQFAHLLNHLDMGMSQLLSALDRLSALDLLVLYKKAETYYLELRAPLSPVAFLAQPAYRTLLEKRIGEEAVSLLTMDRPGGLVRVSKQFAQVFDEEGQPLPQQQAPQGFDLDLFKQQMGRDGLRFKAEQSDIIALYRLAEQHQLTWYQTYQLAKKTAVGQLVSISRMTQQLQAQQHAQLAGPSPVLSPSEQRLVQEAKSKSALQFLKEIKASKRATVSRQDQEFLRQLGESGLLDEVINMVVLFTFKKVDSANLNEKYALKVANELRYRQVTTAEAALQQLKQGGQKSSAEAKPTPASAKSNVPTWSNPDYRVEATAEELAELAQLQAEIMQNLAQGGEVHGKDSE